MSRGSKNIFWGALIIGIGLLNGSSVFLGNAGWFDYLFDSLGSLWVLMGIYQIVKGACQEGDGR